MKLMDKKFFSHVERVCYRYKVYEGCQSFWVGLLKCKIQILCRYNFRLILWFFEGPLTRTLLKTANWSDWYSSWTSPWPSAIYNFLLVSCKKFLMAPLLAVILILFAAKRRCSWKQVTLNANNELSVSSGMLPQLPTNFNRKCLFLHRWVPLWSP
jgi:hypothetical protein